MPWNNGWAHLSIANIQHKEEEIILKYILDKCCQIQ